MHHGEFRDPRLVAVYDADFAWSVSDDFFLSVVREAPGARVLDLGCGTGRFTLGLAAAGYAVTGVDPARASLEAARRKPGATDVTWLEGTSADLPEAGFDVALMTSHVAQLFVGDEEWASTLADLRRALVPGGRLLFDSRDPRARGWERWNPVDSRHDVSLPDGRVVEVWTETGCVPGASPTVTATLHYSFPEGRTLLSTVALRFRSEAEIRATLAAEGFHIDAIYGGWRREAVGHSDGELLVLAHSS